MNCIALLLIAVTSGFIQTDKESSLSATRAVLLTLDDEWNMALLKHDVNYFSRSFKDHFLFVDERGRVFGKLNFVGGVSGTFYSLAESKDREVDIYDGFAILVGARTERFKQPFPDSEERFRRICYVKVFKKEGSSWQVVSYQETPIGPF